ncbi:ribonuclease R [Amnimonas aquatica]|uniref:Ribonuclease R n=1 Tax=Amnimonas aquatica TaxID=2094561 RepID=A0A2P6ATK6_9GAMM|nr:ribonuclease R [Amnimonas aquatica]PQA47957.1 ribonuclease R [Amnimonas aquatica]
MSRKNTPAVPQDPHAAREAERYENPVPSREMILATLDELGKPLTHPQLAHHFEIFDAEREEALRRRLIAMSRDGQLRSDRRGAYQPLHDEELIRGRVQGHKDGFGFLAPDEGGQDLILPSRQMRLLFDGDIACVRIGGYDHKGRREGIVVRVEERRYTHLVGRYREEDGIGYVMPDNPRITQEILVTQDGMEAQPDQFVTVEITEYPSHRGLATGRIVEVLGDYMAPGMEIDIALRNYDIPDFWPAAVEAEIARLSPEVDEDAKREPGRVDIRDLPLITIDGEDAKDFDDAVFAEKRKGGGFRLVVAIADVSYYVRPDTALDTEAKARGNSVYFPGFVVPMLPEILSNGLCSLNPHVDRLCMVCDMNFSAAGRMTGSKFYAAVMHSQARTTYTQVSQYLEHADSAEAAALRKRWPEPAQKSLKVLYELFGVLRAVREQRGALDFDSGETRIIFGQDRKIERIVPVTRNKAHMLIEEMMLAANVASAAYVLKAKMPALFRNHEGPQNEKLIKLRSFLQALGLRFTAAPKPKPADFLAVINQIAERPDRHVIQTMLLRSLSQAVYSPDNLGHFGLAYEAYSHFTSPIRRYPDLLLHRAIKSVLAGESETTALQRVSRALKGALGGKVEPLPGQVQMMALGEHCSMTERRADEATRDVMAWLKCEYMQDRIGEEFDGVISAVTSFGFFVELKDVYVEGLVHISQLKDDYYSFDATFHRLEGERTRRRYGIGEPVRIRVAAVNLDERKMDFELLAGGATGKRSMRERLRDGEIPGRDESARDGKAGGRSAKAGSGKPAGGGKQGGGRGGPSGDGGAPAGDKPAGKPRRPRTRKR